ncbi:MAG: PKD domain-containing protein [bacterium]|nr:PKD domain-containing protein [bacterium]
MQKLKLLVLVLLTVSLTLTFAADVNKVTLVSSTQNETVLKFEVNSFDFKRVQTQQGEEVILVAPNSSRMIKKGAPDLIKLTVPVIISDTGNTKVEILDSKYIDLDHIKLAPSKGIILRTKNPKNIRYKYGSTYKKDEFYPGTLASLDEPYIARDYRGQTVVVNAFQYNPVKSILRVYTSMTIKIKKTDNRSPKNELTRLTKPSSKGMNSQFRDVYSRHFINFTDSSGMLYSTLPDDFGKMLIVCHSDFLDEMADFVTWKEGIGYDVDLVDYSTIGSSSALATYVQNYYDTNGLAYLLLVGDHAQVPTSGTTAGDSDNNYGYVSGSDHYLDIFVGRFSAESSADVQTQVDRTIYYERDVAASAQWFKSAIGMGSSEGPGHNNEYDYVHIENMLADLTSANYTTNTCHQSGGSASQMSSLINAGAGTIFYAGHGTENSWYTTSWSYTSTNVNALTNDNELPFIFSVACVVGNFKNNTCYSEIWQRATNNGVPTGAVVNCGSTINQSWTPPMTAQDEMADILTAGTRRTFGGIFVNGMFKMIEEHGTDGQNMADTWTCFGDASVQVRTPAAPDGPSSGPPSAPTANFSGNPTNVAQNGSVNFTDTSSNSPTSWSWTFDGGSPSASTDQNPTVTYPALGTYAVTLTVSNSVGSDSETKNGYITVTEQTVEYCLPASTNINYEWIAGVEVGSLNNTSGAAYYSDFTSMAANLTAGANVGVTLNPGFASTTYNEYWRIWIDYNIDGDFDDTGEQVFNGSGTSTVSGSFTVPASAAGVTTRMRVIMNYSAVPTPCDTFTYGEVEDYTVNITAGTVEIPVAEFSAGSSTITAGDSVTFTDQSTNDPTSWAWTFDGGTPSSSTSQNPSVQYDAAGTYSVTLTATNSAGSDSETKTNYITVNEQVIQYCTASGNNQNYEWIAGVNVGTVNNSSAGDAGYTDYTSLTSTVSAGSSVSVTLTPGFASSTYNEYWRIYIDYNSDGDFDDSGEEVFSGSGSSTVSGSFTVPASATGVNTRMRVVMDYNSSISACGTFTYGEVEDYMINIQ